MSYLCIPSHCTSTSLSHKSRSRLHVCDRSEPGGFLGNQVAKLDTVKDTAKDAGQDVVENRMNWYIRRKQ